jgi:hypothetical protein
VTYLDLHETVGRIAQNIAKAQKLSPDKDDLLVGTASRLLCEWVRVAKLRPWGRRPHSGTLEIIPDKYLPNALLDLAGEDGGELVQADCLTPDAANNRWVGLRFIEAEIPAPRGRQKGSTGSAIDDTVPLRFIRAMPSGTRGAVPAAAKAAHATAAPDELPSHIKRLRRKLKAGQSR